MKARAAARVRSHGERADQDQHPAKRSDGDPGVIGPRQRGIRAALRIVARYIDHVLGVAYGHHQRKHDENRCHVQPEVLVDFF
jgi:hypothetical protein